MSGSRPCPRCGTPIPGGPGLADCPGCLLDLAHDPIPVDSAPTETLGPSGRPHSGTIGPRPTTLGAGGPADSAGQFAPPEVPSVGTTVSDREEDGAAGHSPRSLRYFGDYELLERLGEGGMGVVYRARQVSLDRLVAVKMLQNAEFASEDRRRRFRIEAEAVARLDHPNIVPILEIGSHAGQPYFSMKLIRGTNLEAALLSFRGDHRAIAGVVATVAEAIQHAHERMVLHRDLKPANILLDDLGMPHVTDFGLARRLDLASGPTATLGTVLGTPGYMAPEQLEGRRDAVTPCTDVYGLGAVLYALLTGHPPFRESQLGKLLDAVRSGPPEPPSRADASIPIELEAVCLKCLERDPGRRYPTAAALADDLRRFVDGRPVAAAPARRPSWGRPRHRRPGPRAGSRGPEVTAVVAALAVGLLLLAAWAVQVPPLDRLRRPAMPDATPPGAPVAGTPSAVEFPQVAVAIRSPNSPAAIVAGGLAPGDGGRRMGGDRSEEHPDTVLLQPGRTLAYQIEVSNRTGGAVPVVVRQQWDSGASRVTRLALPAGRHAPGVIEGRISAEHLDRVSGLRTLTIEVWADEDGRDRPLCEPKRVVFRGIGPEDFLKVTPLFGDGPKPQVALFVNHVAPGGPAARVMVSVEPFAAVRQVAAPSKIEPGGLATYRYLIVDTGVERLRFSLTVDGRPDAIVREFSLIEPSPHPDGVE